MHGSSLGRLVERPWAFFGGAVLTGSRHDNKFGSVVTMYMKHS